MRAHRFYSWLMRAFPATFRERHQTAMEQQFRDEYREACSRRERSLLWLRAIADIAGSAPGEVAREVRQDLKYTAHVYRKHAISGLLAVTALGLSIGASVAVFGVLNALLLRSLPFRAPEELVELHLPPVTVLSGRTVFHEWSRRSTYLADAGAFSLSDVNMTVSRGAVRVKAAETTANFFSLLGMSPVAGRTFTPEEETPGHTGVAVISHGLWQQFFGGDPVAPGAVIQLNGTPFTIVGVAPPHFDFPGKAAVWTPSIFDGERIPKHGAIFYQTIGRLKPDIRLESAQFLFQQELQQLSPKRPIKDGPDRARIASIRDTLAGPIGRASWALAGMILLVLLAAGANIAHLLLSRVAERRQEFALRTSLGASHGRIVQQLITEATTIAALGAALGLILAHWGSKIASSVAPPQLASQQYTVLDWRVAAFAMVIAVAMGVTFGVLPSSLLRERPAEVVIPSANLRDHRTRRARFLLVSVQACLTLALLASSITMGRTFLRLLDLELGFRTSNTVTMTVSLQGTKHRTASAVWSYYTEALQRLRAAPGVEAAGAVSYVPLQEQFYMAGSFTLDSGQAVNGVIINAATHDYFRAMGTRFIAGGDFPALDPGGARTVIVSEAFARATGLGPAIVGREIVSSWASTSYVVQGVVESSRFAGPSGVGLPMIYWPVAEEPPPNLTLVARVRGDARKHLASCRDAVRALDPHVPLYDVQTLDQRLANVLARPRFYVIAILVLAAVALLLAIAGTFGTAAHSVSQRTQEFGIRMALGASTPRLRTGLLRETLAPTAAGGVMGIALASAQSRYLAHLLVDVTALGFWNCTAAAVILVLAAAAGSWAATARLLAIDPAVAIRESA